MPHIYPEDCSSAHACGRTWQDGSHPFHPWEFAVCLRLAFRKGLTLEVPCAWGVELAAVFSVKPGWFSDVLDSGCCNPWIKGLRYLASTSRVWEAHIQYRSWICPGRVADEIHLSGGGCVGCRRAGGSVPRDCVFLGAWQEMTWPQPPREAVIQWCRTGSPDQPETVESSALASALRA